VIGLLLFIGTVYGLLMIACQVDRRKNAAPPQGDANRKGVE
jgi:hypothetical protein